MVQCDLAEVWRFVLHVASVSNNKLRKQREYLLFLLFNPEDGESTFF
jgi:hypothetical protein